jgi:hypothetical protein
VIENFLCTYSSCWWYRYYGTYVPFLLEACNDENPDVRQVCPDYLYYFASLVNVGFIKKMNTMFFRQLFMGLVFAQSLVDLCLNHLLEVVY